MKADFLPLIVDVVAVNRPRPGDPISEPFVLELATADDTRIFVPVTIAAAQSLVQLLDPHGDDEPVCAPRPARHGVK